MAEPNMDQPVDGQGKVFTDPGWSPLRCEKLVTFTGGTTDAWGDDGGARDGGVLFTVTGTVRIRIMGVVETTLVGGATANVGTSKDVTGLLPQVADTSGMAINETWHMTDGTVDSSTELSSVVTEKTVANGLDILFYNGTANITSGAIRFLVSWFPVSANGNVTPSTL